MVLQRSNRVACREKIAETPSESSDTSTALRSLSRITVEDRLRLIEALLSDEAKTKLLATQECLGRQETDARTSVTAVEDYVETVSNIFNDESWIPMLTDLQDLHPALADARKLPLRDCRTTRSKVKEKHNDMKNYLHTMVIKWEQSGNSGIYHRH
jgi:hypothetical protein